MKTAGNKKLAVLFWFLTAVCMVVIFYFSSRTAEESSLQSKFIYKLITDIFGENVVTMFIVRKLAHFLEFTGTALVMSGAFYFTIGKNKPYLPIIFTSLYAVTDEYHQRFVEGRACEIRDWMIDTLGAITGVILFLIIFCIIIKLCTRRKNK